MKNYKVSKNNSKKGRKYLNEKIIQNMTNDFLKDLNI